MNKKFLLFIIPALLIAATLGYTYTPNKPVNTNKSTDQLKTLNLKQEPITQTISWVDSITLELEALLSQKKYVESVQLIDNIYQQANADELDSFRTLIFIFAENLIAKENYQSARTLLKEYSITFNDVDGWRRLADTQTFLKDWEGAVSSYLRSSELEYRPDILETTLHTLIRASNYVRANLERKGDELGILKLYQTIYQQHPNYPRFQLELAQSYLRLNDPQSARPLLETLQYDESLGSLAKQKLAALDQKQIKQSNILNSETIIPLIRSGNSLLIEVLINGNNLRMLLDTGASITALSHETISLLNLSPTGQVIQLSTANGIVSSQLYSAPNLVIGQQIIPDLLVAQIDMNSSNVIQGLLGTDVLNLLGGFIIDNQRNELIIKR